LFVPFLYHTGKHEFVGLVWTCRSLKMRYMD
jgi:hypothetical protein